MDTTTKNKNSIIICSLDVPDFETIQSPSEIPADAKKVIEIIKSELYDNKMPPLNILKDIGEAGINLIAKPTIDATPVAIASAYVEEGRPGIAWLQSLAVAESYQGDGIGSQLIGVLAEVAVQRGVNELGLRVNDGDRVVSFYERLGFIERPDFGGSSAIVDMFKPLR